MPAPPLRPHPRRPRPALALASAVVLVLAVLVIDTARAAPADGAPADGEPRPGPMSTVGYRPPVDAPVLDPFRAPTHPYGPGNRGIDYRVAPGTLVQAMGDGEVIFAGLVAGALHVTIRHADGLRTSYSFLASVSVHAGQHVRRGDEVGRSSEVLHVGARTPDGTYLDPASLFGSPTRAHLVPGGDDGTDEPPLGSDRAALAAVVTDRLRPLGALLATGPGPAPDLLARVRLWQDVLVEADWTTHLSRIGVGLTTWWRDRDDCTPDTAPAPRPGAGRIVVEVGGIGSTSQEAAVADVDTAALGYAPGDVIRFSYAGGRVPGAAATSVPVTAYDAVDSQQPLSTSADRLGDLLRSLAADRPGVPIDVVAHSQGGVVARAAIAGSAARGALPTSVAHLVTIAAPHRGADVAAAVVLGQQGTRGPALEVGAQEVLGLDLDARLPAARDLAPGSTLLEHVDDLGWPDAVPFTSIAGRGDLVVPVPRTSATGARSVVVDEAGPAAHGALPGAAATGRELALALGDHPPGCRGLTEVVADQLSGETAALHEARAALAAAVATG